MPDEPPPPLAIPVEPAPLLENQLQSEHDGEGIYCPLCNYNLTGVMAGRCPECGALFDRKALLATQKASRVTLIPWDSPKVMPFGRRLVSTLRICLFKPDRFAFAFSVQPQRTRAAGFMFIVMLVTIFACIAAVLVNEGLDQGSFRWTSRRMQFTLLALSSFLLTVIVGTTLGAGLLLGASCPHYDGKRHLKPWLSVCAYASSHYLLLLVILPMALFVPWEDRMILMLAGFMGCLACGMLCWCTMVEVVKHRTAEHRRGPMTSLLLAGIYVIGTALAVFVAGIVANVLVRLMRGY